MPPACIGAGGIAEVEGAGAAVAAREAAVMV